MQLYTHIYNITVHLTAQLIKKREDMLQLALIVNIKENVVKLSSFVVVVHAFSPLRMPWLWLVCS